MSGIIFLFIIFALFGRRLFRPWGMWRRRPPMGGFGMRGWGMGPMDHMGMGPGGMGHGPGMDHRGMGPGGPGMGHHGMGPGGPGGFGGM